MTRTFFSMAGAFAFLLCAGAGVHAADATLLVTATVKRHASVRMAMPATLTVTADDLARGWVDVPAPVEVAVRSNVQDGYTLVFERGGGVVRSARVAGFGGPLVVGAGPALAARPAAGRGMWQDVVQLHFRFELDAAATAGRHPWPVQVSMMSN